MTRVRTDAGGTQAALRIDEKYAGRHDRLAGRQAFAHLDAFAHARTDFHCARLEHVRGCSDEDVLRLAGINHCVAWDGEGFARSDCKLRGAVQTRWQFLVRVGNDKADLRLARSLRERRIYE